jgi:hypothetical protein
MTKRCSRSGKKSKDELPAITLNPGALSQLNDYNRAPRRLSFAKTSSAFSFNNLRKPDITC